jgi:hypothetical protein
MYRQCETRRMRELLTRHAEAYNRLATRAAAMAVAVFAVTFAVVGTGAGPLRARHWSLLSPCGSGRIMYTCCCEKEGMACCVRVGCVSSLVALLQVSGTLLTRKRRRWSRCAPPSDTTSGRISTRCWWTTQSHNTWRQWYGNLADRSRAWCPQIEMFNGKNLMEMNERSRDHPFYEGMRVLW